MEFRQTNRNHFDTLTICYVARLEVSTKIFQQSALFKIFSDVNLYLEGLFVWKRLWNYWTDLLIN